LLSRRVSFRKRSRNSSTLITTLLKFPLRRRQRPDRPRHQKETGIRPSGSFAGFEQISLCLRHSWLLLISDTTQLMSLMVHNAAVKTGPPPND